MLNQLNRFSASTCSPARVVAAALPMSVSNSA